MTPRKDSRAKATTRRTPAKQKPPAKTKRAARTATSGARQKATPKRSRGARPKPAETAFPIDAVLAEVAAFTSELRPTSMAQVAGAEPDAFQVLIGTLLSLRTQDRHTAEACARLFAEAPDIAAMEQLAEDRIAELIYPVGFYRTKAARTLEICAALRERHDGTVPTDLDALIALPGVGRKTANLTLTLGHQLPGICVDIHVHRICNRWGYVATRTPDQTEMRLREILPERYWIPINDWLVLFGQTVCRPLSPHCSTCRVAAMCARVDVDRHR